MGCRNTSSQIPILNISPKELVKVQKPLTIPIDSTSEYFNELIKKASVVGYYQRFGSDPIWIKEEKQKACADSLILFIRNASYYGLNSQRYHIDELMRLGNGLSNSTLIRKELLMTDAFFSLAADLKHGMLKSIRSARVDSVELNLLHRVALNGNLRRQLESQEPLFKGYTALRHGLALILDSLKMQAYDSIGANDKIRVISINLDRWRNEEANLSQRHIFINIPSYMLDVVEDDSVVLSSRIIVGTPDKETPLISSVVECLSIYPYWHVPRKIAVEEYLPIIKLDTSFITRSNFDVLDRKGRLLNPDSIDWSKFTQNYFPVSLRQREGPENSLGVIKFVFDNPYAVYLHDTNAKRLFKNKERAFSHGCIRMERAVDLAHYLVTGKMGVESNTIARYLKERQQHWVELNKPIPIYVRYFTCEYKDGKLFVFKDIYKNDQPLYERLFYNLTTPGL